MSSKVLWIWSTRQWLTPEVFRVHSRCFASTRSRRLLSLLRVVRVLIYLRTCSISSERLRRLLNVLQRTSELASKASWSCSRSIKNLLESPGSCFKSFRNLPQKSGAFAPEFFKTYSTSQSPEAFWNCFRSLWTRSDTVRYELALKVVPPGSLRELLLNSLQKFAGFTSTLFWIWSLKNFSTSYRSLLNLFQEPTGSPPHGNWASFWRLRTSSASALLTISALKLL